MVETAAPSPLPLSTWEATPKDSNAVIFASPPSADPLGGERDLDATLSIQDVAAQTGLTVHTLRYYERAGLLPRVGRNDGGHRRYTESDVRFLAFLTRLRSTGMPIHQVRRYAELVREGAPTVDARRRMLVAHRDAVRRHMDELRDNLRVLDLKIELYGGLCEASDTPHCLK